MPDCAEGSSRINKIRLSVDLHRESVRNIIGAGIALIVILIAYGCFPNYCATNDDHVIDSILSGEFTGHPDAHVIYVNYSLAWIARLPYYLDSSIPWWGIMLVAVQAMSLWLVGKSILKLLAKTTLQPFFSIVVSLLIAFSIFLYPVANPNFGITAAMIGSASLLLLLCLADGDDSRLTIIIDSTMMILAILLSYCLRRATCEVVWILIGIVLIYRIVQSRRVKQSFFIPAFVVAVSLLCTGLVIAIHNNAYDSPEWQSYQQYNTARSKYIDYKKVPYETAPNLYDDYGISEHLAYLINLHYSADNQISADLFRHLSEFAGNSGENRNVFQAVLKSYNEQYSVKTGLIIGVVSFFVSLLFCFRKRLALEEVLLIGAVLVISIALLLYLCYLGRSILRATVMIFVPMLALETAVCCKGLSRVSKSIGEIAPISLVCLSLFFGVVQGAQTAANQGHFESMAIKTARYQTFQDYASSHSRTSEGNGCIYLFDYSVPEDNSLIQNTKGKSKTENVLPLGGWYSRSPLISDKMNMLGIEEMSPEMYLLPNVYYATTDEEFADNLLAYLNDCLNEEYFWSIDDELNGGIRVMHLERADARLEE